MKEVIIGKTVYDPFGSFLCFLLKVVIIYDNI